MFLKNKSIVTKSPSLIFYKFFNKWFNNMRGFYFKKLGFFLHQNPKISAAIESLFAKTQPSSSLLGSFFQYWASSRDVLA